MMKKLIFWIALMALLVGLVPTAALAQTPTIELATLDSMFATTKYWCYPDTVSGFHIKVEAWPKNTEVTSPLSKVEQPYRSFTSGQPSVGVVSDAWFEYGLSDSDFANCPTMPSAYGTGRNLAITVQEVLEGLGPDSEILCFRDRSDGVRAVRVAAGSTINSPVTHVDYANGVMTAGNTTVGDIEGTAWLAGKLLQSEWLACTKWEDPNRPAVSAAPLPAEMVTFINLFLQWIQASGFVFPAALPALAPTAIMTLTLTITPTAALTTTLTITPTAALTTTDTVTLTVEVTQRSWVRVVADDAVLLEGVREPGFKQEFAASRSLLFRTGNAAGVSLTFNGEVQPSLGGAGEIANWSWTPGEVLTVAEQLNILLGLDADGQPKWGCFPDRYDGVQVWDWPGDLMVSSPAGAVTGSDGLEYLPGGGSVPPSGPATIWLNVGLEVDPAECPG